MSSHDLRHEFEEPFGFVVIEFDFDPSTGKVFPTTIHQEGANAFGKRALYDVTNLQWRLIAEFLQDKMQFKAAQDLEERRRAA